MKHTGDLQKFLETKWKGIGDCSVKIEDYIFNFFHEISIIMLTMDKIISLDYFLTNLFSKLIPHNQFFDRFFSFFSLKGSFIFIWLLVILIVLILEERKNPGITKQDKKFIFIFSVSFLLTFLLSDF